MLCLYSTVQVTRSTEEDDRHAKTVQKSFQQLLLFLSSSLAGLLIHFCHQSGTFGFSLESNHQHRMFATVDESANERTPFLTTTRAERNPTNHCRRWIGFALLSFSLFFLALVLVYANRNCSTAIVSDDDSDNYFGISAAIQGGVWYNIENENDGKPTTNIDALFKNFCHQFGKTYDSDDEYNRRREIFRNNIEQIERHNNDLDEYGNPKHGWTMGTNRFADMLPEEIPKGFRKSSLHGKHAHATFSETSSKAFSLMVPSANVRRRKLLSALPEFVDWRTSTPPVTTPVKDQGMCGSCWAFAATAVLESYVAISTGKLLSLSPQELVSCAPNPDRCGGTGGCSGSTGELAYDYVSKHGMVTEWADGYTSYHGKTGNCTLKNGRNGFLQGARASVAGFSSLPSNSYDSLMYAVATFGPVVVSVAANSWGLYKGGVFDDSDLTKHYDINHAVVLEGYVRACARSSCRSL